MYPNNNDSNQGYNQNNGQPTIPYGNTAGGNYSVNGDNANGTYSYTPNQGHTSYQQPPISPSNPPERPCKEKKTFGLGAMIICIVLSVALSASASLAVAFRLLSDAKTDTVDSTDTSSAASQETDENAGGDVGGILQVDGNGNVTTSIEAVYEKSAPSVVGIRATSRSYGIFGGSETGEGSGVIYSADGYIVTNYHVIENAVKAQNESSSIEVFLPSDSNTAVEASVIGYNISADLAVIKIEKTGLPKIELGNSDNIKVGQYAIAIGCPGGLEFMGSVSYGIVSGLDRSITIDSIGEMKLIQTDAAINPGNSGGALLDSKGKLIGINSSKLVDESFEGMGFAIPVNHMVDVVRDIIENKDNPTPYIGIEVYTYNSAYLEKYGYPHGAAIKSVVSGSPADNARLEPGDIITEFNSIAIEEYTDYIEALEKCKPGAKVPVKIYRNGRYYVTTVTVGSNNSR